MGAGNTRRITRPSFVGLMPISEVRMARSIAPISEVSHGLMASTRASATLTAAIWLMGVGVP